MSLLARIKSGGAYVPECSFRPSSVSAARHAAMGGCEYCTACATCGAGPNQCACAWTDAAEMPAPAPSAELISRTPAWVARNISRTGPIVATKDLTGSR